MTLLFSCNARGFYLLPVIKVILATVYNCPQRGGDRIVVGMCVPNFQASRYIEVDNYFSVYQISWTREFVQCEVNTADTAALFIAKISSSETVVKGGGVI